MSRTTSVYDDTCFAIKDAESGYAIREFFRIAGHSGLGCALREDMDVTHYHMQSAIKKIKSYLWK